MAIWDAIKQLIQKNKKLDKDKTAEAVKQVADAMGIHIDTHVNAGRQAVSDGTYATGATQIINFKDVYIPNFGRDTNNYKRMHKQVIVRRQQLKKAGVIGEKREKTKNSNRPYL